MTSLIYNVARERNSFVTVLMGSIACRAFAPLRFAIFTALACTVQTKGPEAAGLYSLSIDSTSLTLRCMWLTQMR